MRLNFLLIILLFAITNASQAQRYGKRHIRQNINNDTAIVRAYIDSLNIAKEKINDSIITPDSLLTETEADSRLYKITSPLTFYNSTAGNWLRGSDDYASAMIDRALMNVYINRPELVSVTEKELQDIGQLHEELTQPMRHKIEYTAEKEQLPDATVDQPLEIVVNKPQFWRFSGDYYLQFLQNYVSGNWYKGGESNYSMVASATLQANYDNKQKVKFDNKLELKLGFQTSRGDSLHSFKTSEDLIRYTGKLGLAQCSLRLSHTTSSMWNVRHLPHAMDLTRESTR